jgi:hypothetical protein
MTGIYMSCIFSWTIPLQLAASGLFGLPSAPGRFRPGVSANLIGLGDRKATHSRLGPAKVPQPGADLINMAAPA